MADLLAHGSGLTTAFPVSQWLLRQLTHRSQLRGAAAASERQSSVPRSLFILIRNHQALTLMPLDFRSQSLLWPRISWNWAAWYRHWHQ